MVTITLCVLSKNSAKEVIESLSSFIPIIDYFYVMDMHSEDDTVQSIREWFENNLLNGIVETYPSSSKSPKIGETYMCNRAKETFPDASYLFYLGYPFFTLSIADSTFTKDQLTEDVYSLIWSFDDGNGRNIDSRVTILLKYTTNMTRDGLMTLTYFSDNYVRSNTKKLNSLRLHSKKSL